MRRIIYASQATAELCPEDLVRLLDTARRHNQETGLSGMLLYSNQSFLQVLEGDEAPLRRTYDRILVDPRHTDLRQLLDAEVDRPLFPDWTMGFEHVSDGALAAELPGFTPATVYPLVDPGLVTNAGLAQTLLTLYAKNAAV